MNKQEFLALTTKKFTDKQYEIIEFVYTYHPSIDSVEGKKQIAYLFDTFGMRIILDMQSTAAQAKIQKDKIMKLQLERDIAIQDFDKFKHGIIANLI